MTSPNDVFPPHLLMEVVLDGRLVQEAVNGHQLRMVSEDSGRSAGPSTSTRGYEIGGLWDQQLTIIPEGQDLDKVVSYY